MQILEIQVLDHGYVRFIEDWGHGDAREPEAGIIEAARQSTQGCFRGWEKDQKLLEFLFTSKPPHAGPFEFAGMVIEVQAPIFVFREWHRHRTMSYNEMSARYAPIPNLNYIPTLERCMLNQGKANKQAAPVSGAQELTEEVAKAWLNQVPGFYDEVEDLYQFALDNGIPKELARIVMPVGRYSRMRASAVLRNWLAFMTLRADPGAQWEIRQYAQAVGAIISEKFPRTWSLFVDSKSQKG